MKQVSIFIIDDETGRPIKRGTINKKDSKRKLEQLREHYGNAEEDNDGDIVVFA